ncbi:DUF6359 domain-containing protein [Persicobacter diffluens]|uniref:Endonuclease YhcR N-terminal domain-containing protein n=1 Tax=Persicobacter diffluens TaxID=981 RepID=A0AAN5AM34_9BACT|nr:hypothetical protein PEDI_20350 [Persicobacter diffluens]
MRYTLFLFSTLLLTACLKHPEVQQDEANITLFTTIMDNSRLQQIAYIDHAYLELTNTSTTTPHIFDSLEVIFSEGQIHCESFLLAAGTYQIDKFELRDANGDLLYFAPAQDHHFCELIDHACLPIPFEAIEGITTPLQVGVTNNYTPSENGPSDYSQLEIAIYEITSVFLTAFRYHCDLQAIEYFQGAPIIRDHNGAAIPFIRINADPEPYQYLLFPRDSLYQFQVMWHEEERHISITHEQLIALGRQSLSFHFDSLNCENITDSIPDTGTDPEPAPEIGNALTIPEALANEGLNDVDVVGYIVGTTSSGPNLKHDGPYTSATNIALADQPDITDAALIVPVQLPTGDIRDALNLVDNPANEGRRIIIKEADLQSYFSTIGAKNPKGFEWVE